MIDKIRVVGALTVRVVGIVNGLELRWQRAAERGRGIRVLGEREASDIHRAATGGRRCLQVEVFRIVGDGLGAGTHQLDGGAVHHHGIVGAAVLQVGDRATWIGLEDYFRAVSQVISRRKLDRIRIRVDRGDGQVRADRVARCIAVSLPIRVIKLGGLRFLRVDLRQGGLQRARTSKLKLRILGVRVGAGARFEVFVNGVENRAGGSEGDVLPAVEITAAPARVQRVRRSDLEIAPRLR